MNAPVKVIYNAACPICEGEMRHYKKRAAAGDAAVDFIDLNTSDLSQYGLTPDSAARRLHVVEGSEVKGGVEAFLALWRAVPGMGWLARIVALPGVRHVADYTYDRLVAPRIYRRFRPGDPDGT